jgi:tryptophan aminotransferase
MEKVPGMISMLAGKPNPTLFPITSISITVRSPIDGGATEKVLQINGPDLDEALQYGPTSGIPKAEQWFKGMQEAAHHRKEGPDWDLAVGSGSQDLLYKVCVRLFGTPSPA